MTFCTLERHGRRTRPVTDTPERDKLVPWTKHASINAAKRFSRAYQQERGGLGMGSVRNNKGIHHE